MLLIDYAAIFAIAAFDIFRFSPCFTAICCYATPCTVSPCHSPPLRHYTPPHADMLLPLIFRHIDITIIYLRFSPYFRRLLPLLAYADYV